MAFGLRLDNIGQNSRLVFRGRGYQLQAGDEFIAPRILGTETVVSQGGTAQVEVRPGKLVVIQGGTLWDLKLNSGVHYPCSEGGGTMMFDISHHRAHAQIKAQDFDNLHIKFRDDQGSNALNDYGYSTYAYFDIATLELGAEVGYAGDTVTYNNETVKYLHGALINPIKFWFELEDSRDVYYLNGDIQFSGPFEISYAGYIDLGVAHPVAKLDFSNTGVKLFLDDIKDWPLIGSVYLQGTETYGQITNCLGWQINGSLVLRGLANVTGDIKGLQNCNFHGILDLAYSSVSGDISSLSNQKGLQYLFLNNTAISGDIGTLIDFHSLKTVDISDTSISGDIGGLGSSPITIQFNARNSDIGGLINDLISWQPRQFVDFANTNVAGDLKYIKHWPITGKVDFSNTQVSEFSENDTLFPECIDLNFENCPLTRDAVDNILIAKDLDGKENGKLNLINTNSPSWSGFIAYKNLIDKGWEIDLPMTGDLWLDAHTTAESPTNLRYIIQGTSLNYLYNGELHSGSSQEVIFEATPDIQINMLFSENLEGFKCVNNYLEGNFPSFTDSRNLKYFNIMNNKFAGTIPSLYNLTQLVYFNIEGNEFTDFAGGILPSTLKYITCSYNKLSPEAVTRFLVALDAAGATDGIALFVGEQMGAPLESGLEAAENLRVKGWTVEYQGAYKDPICDTDIVYDNWVLEDDTQMGGCTLSLGG